MSPAFIPSVKELATHLTAKDAQTILKRALRFSTTAGVKRFMSEQLQQLAPNLALLETT